MLIIDSLIISGVRFVLGKLIEAVDAELYDETSLREELLAAQMKLELGEITEEDFTSIEEVVLSGLRDIGKRKRAAAGAPEQAGEGQRYSIESVDADLDHREEPER